MPSRAVEWALRAFLCLAVSKLAAGQNTSTLRPEVGEAGGPLPDPPEQRESPGTFQSDMLLTAEQAEDIAGSQRDRAVRTGYWPDAKIPYQIDESFGATMVRKIQEAMDWWRKDTCVTFEEYLPSSSPESDHRVLFKKVDEGCYSDVGMINQFPQHINLQEDTCDVTGTIAHEIGHTVGWWHEHTREDRDLYVTIRYENIQSGKYKQFIKHQGQSYGVPYDAASIMHYASTYFSKNNFVTIEPHKPLEAFKMGNRKHFTFFDKKLANLMYNCSGVCAEDVQCENDGYVGKDCTCQCKVDYSGDRCEVYNAADDDDPCFKELEAKLDSDQQLNSPGSPQPYGPLLYCPRLITAPERSTITLTFLFLDTEGGACTSDYVKVRNGADMFYGGNSYCGHTLPDPIESVGNQMMVIFRSDGSIQGLGFRALYRAHPATISSTTSERTTLEPTTPEPSTPEANTPEPTTSEVTTPEPTTSEATTSGATTSEATTPQPTTAEPTTLKPTTPEPTTREPSTPEANTPEATTSGATTSGATTSEATTPQPTTPEPTTLEPATREPSTPEANTPEPTTSEVTTPEPTTSEATTPQPTTAEPTTLEPTTPEPTIVPEEPTTLPEQPTTQIPCTPKPTAPRCGDVEGTCGGQFHTDSGCIASPNFGIGGEYNNNEVCVYRITVDSGKRVELRLEQLDVEYQETCTWDKLVVIPGQTHGSVRVCGQSIPEGSFVSLDNTMTVKMISDAYVSKGGFAASFHGITVD